MRKPVLISVIIVTVFVVAIFAFVCDEAIAQDRARTQSKAETSGPRETTRIVREIRHELLTLPYYGVFDWLEGQVQPDGIVALRGQVVRPTTKSDAEARVREIEGVEKVVNEIKVLPLSPNDERLRLALYRAIFNDGSPIFRYSLGSNPSIHIIVDNGRVTLKGVVSSESDKQLAYTQARSVAGAFEVNNELVIGNSDRK